MGRGRGMAAWVGGLWLLCGSVLAAESPEWAARREGWLHVASRLAFPARVARLEPASPGTQAGGAPGYRAADHGLVITLAVEPKPGPHVRELFFQALRGLQQVHGTLHSGPTDPISLPWLGLDPHPEVAGAYVTYSENGKEFATLLVLAPADDRMVKLEAVWPAHEQAFRYALRNVAALLREVSLEGGK